jgi:hypothetical protein
VREQVDQPLKKRFELWFPLLTQMVLTALQGLNDGICIEPSTDRLLAN